MTWLFIPRNNEVDAEPAIRSLEGIDHNLIGHVMSGVYQFEWDRDSDELTTLLEGKIPEGGMLVEVQSMCGIA